MSIIGRIISLIALAIFFLVILSLIQFYQIIRPFKITSSITPKTLGIPYENISFKSFDGTNIQGWWIPNKNKHAKTIILLHGYPADKGNILPTTIFLHDHYNLLYLDFRYFGQSSGQYSSLGFYEVNDVLAAIYYLEQKNIHHVAIWGFSFGGAVALMTAAKTNAVNAVIADASYAQLDWMTFPIWRTLLGAWANIFLGIDVKAISPINAAKTLSIPILIIHSKNDEVIPFFHAKALQEALKTNPYAVFIFPDHLRHGEHPTNYQTIVKSFLSNQL
jgi:dipeptidyl aminopeptidase/acylaminoacyl peptidase